MRFSRTLSLYFLRETLLYSSLGFLGFSALLVTQNLLRRIDDLLAVGFAWGDLSALIGCLVTLFSPYAVPVAFLFGILLAVGRLSADSEIAAMRSCGLGLSQLLLPSAVLGLFFSAAAAQLLIHSEPEARYRFREVLTNVASRGSILETGRFRGLGQRMVFVRDRDRENHLKGVVISDLSNKEQPFLVFAEGGTFSFNPESADVTLRLYNGDIHFEPNESEPLRYRRIAFEKFDYIFDMSGQFKKELLMTRPREMSLPELRSVIARAESGDALEDLREKNPHVYQTQLHRRISLSLTPLLFAVLGVPLGLRRSRGGRSWGALTCAGVAFAFYAALSFSQGLAESGTLPAWLALWLPNFVLAAAILVALRWAHKAEF